jgi:copper chaperone CopZ
MRSSQRGFILQSSLSTLFRLVFCTFFVFSASAEFRNIEQKFDGIDCASCASSLGSALKRVRGVESVEAKLEDGVVRIRLTPGNTVRIDRIRDAIKGVGFTPKEARVTVKGRPAKVEGKWLFQVEGFDQSYPLGGGKQMDEIRRSDGRTLMIEGMLAAQSDPRVPPALEVTAIRASD